MDKFSQMQAFVRTVEAGSLSAAARQLNVSTAAISRQLAALESDVGAPLLRRTTRRMVITPVGQRYFDLAKNILRDVEAAQSLGRQEAAQGWLRVNASVTFGLASVVPSLPGFMQQHPNIHLDLYLEDRLADLALEDIDVAIRAGIAPPDSPDIIAHPVAAFRRMVVAAASHARQPGDAPQMLRHTPAITSTWQAHDVWNLENQGAHARLPMRSILRCSSLHAVRDLAVRGLGAALLPEWFVRDELASGGLRDILPAWRTAPVQVYAMHRRQQRGAPRIRAFVHYLAEEFRRNGLTV